jgi:hypothetical protein
MRTLIATLVASFTLFAAAPAASAGDPGYTLSMPTEVAIGDSFQACVEAPGGSSVYLLVSGSGATTPTKYGDLSVGLPLLTIWQFQMPPSGSLCLPHQVECVQDIVGATGHFQFVAVGPGPGQVGISNPQQLTAVDDGLCDITTGDFHSYTMGGWGQVCSSNNVGCIRDQWFPLIYPAGLLLGDRDGADGDAIYSLLLTDSLAIQQFLPEGGTPGTLPYDDINPTDSPAGVFSGQLTAAKLNVSFDDFGAFDTLKNQTGVVVGDMIYRSCVHPALIGKTVRNVVKLADGAISGELPVPVDVDGDLIGDVWLSDLSTALDMLNRNFDNGTVNQGCLKLP